MIKFIKNLFKSNTTKEDKLEYKSQVRDTDTIQILEIINKYLHVVLCDEGTITVNNTNYIMNDNYVILEYNKYPELPPARTKIDKLAFMEIKYGRVYLMNGLLNRITNTLINCYYNSTEYQQSKYHKYDIIKEKLQEIEEDFK